MNLRIVHGLPMAAGTVIYSGQVLHLENLLIDTGSAGTVFSADRMAAIGLRYDAGDPVHRIRGVGGAEFVFTKQLDALSIGDLHAQEFEVEIGALDYGFLVDGIIGTDFLLLALAVVDLAKLEVSKSHAR